MATLQFKDYYQTLGLPRGADAAQVRAAYRTLARKHHPDVNPGDKAAEERFKEINEANEVLSDPAKRKMYDRYGEEWQRYRDAGFTGDEPAGGRRAADPADFGEWFATRNGRGAGTNGRGAGERRAPESFSWEYSADGEDAGGFSDFFQTLFGNRTGGRPAGDFASTVRTRIGRRKGDDIEVGVEVTFEEAFRGASRRFEVTQPEPCATCQGTGLARGATCPTCDGTGRVPRAKAIEVRIPAGVASGSRIRVSGQGGVGEGGGPPGDVFLRVTVRPDPRFERDGDDLRTDVPVPYYTALLGGEAVVTTPSGKVALTIPPESQPGRTFRLRGQGMPKLKGGPDARGDLLARLKVTLPTGLTERERELLAELRDAREGA
ncbi:MAG: DnaJ-class molecular chaperone CbpA [uncultured Thermomicrobiales bacterium]|uniref:Chaperone protein DnaJ n=1 Tax=uncultured Thermomicrobiales bacterium TaxID=1645740 RepID=A0A6J4UCX0_9BACT|nr:MAG: DnaJ-class molecular chaperone CbpA [uncultured Thermomicrobiales bacterium]